MYTPTQTLLNKEQLEYGQILALKARMQGYKKIVGVDAGKDASDYEWKEEYRLSQEQQQKGYDWIVDKAFKPSLLARQKEVYEKEGLLDEALRSNNPFGYRELNIILQYSHFTFVGFYDDTRGYYATENGFRTYYPIWRMYDKEGSSFDYHVEGGECVIDG